MAQLVMDRRKLSIPCETVDSIEEGETIAAELFGELSKRQGFGLAAPQIGVEKRVCVIHVNDPYCLINPVIRKAEGGTLYQEGCLSFPGQQVVTTRNVTITVEADNLEEPLVLDPRVKGSTKLDEQVLLESVVVQHEIDHLNGITIFDRKYLRKPVQATETPGRNDKVTLKHPTDDATMEIKYKRAQSLLALGWTIIETENV